ncbi:MAG: repeat protein [Myxococcaceae bacterium]|nr:repeat protein [Myxococcaceae bacterium]
MYVQCERCKTEYEFDDALVSERGTTVKCTNCSHQFKVRRPGGGASTGEDRWVVTTATGKQLVFTSLKELQRAILAKLVDKADSLARGGAPARRLGAIAELEPFFDDKKRQVSIAPQPSSPAASNPPPVKANEARGESVAAQLRPRTKTILSSRPPPPPDASPHPALAAPKRRSEPPPLPMRARVETLRPPDNYLGGGAVPPPPLVPRAMGQPPEADSVVNAHASTVVAPVVEQHHAQPGSVRSGTTELGLPPAPHPGAVSARMASTPAAPPVRSRQISRPPGMEVSSPLPPPVRRTLASDYDTEPPARMPLQSYVERDSMPQNRRLGGWVIAAILLAGVAAVGVYVGKPYLDKMNKPAEAAQPLDPRAQGFLSAGEAALGDGNLDLAKENFDKASVLAEKDQRVLLAIAKLASARADVPWLKQRILPADAEEMKPNRMLLEEMSSKAKKAAEDATAAAPEDPAALRVMVDALRIHGDRDAARALVGKITANASQPDTAYVLGALDLAELDPPWPVVVERLRTAAAGEGTAGRARATLVYALARAGDLAAAKQELDRLSFQPHPHPLLGALRFFVEHAPSKTLDAGAPIAVGDLNRFPGASSGPLQAGGNNGGFVPGPGPTGGAGAQGIPSDPRVILTQAEAAKAKKDYPRARALYEAAVAKNSSDSEALAGLGDVFQAQHDPGSAQSFYKRALAVNPTYLPALLGLADVQWESGERGPAMKTYKDIQDRFPDGSYPARVKQRTESTSQGGSSPSPATSSSSDPQ